MLILFTSLPQFSVKNKNNMLFHNSLVVMLCISRIVYKEELIRAFTKFSSFLNFIFPLKGVKLGQPYNWLMVVLARLCCNSSWEKDFSNLNLELVSLKFSPFKRIPCTSIGSSHESAVTSARDSNNCLFHV